MEYTIKNRNDFYINDIKINEEIFSKELFDYSIVERDDLVDNLIEQINEAKNRNDLELMKNDLKYLINLDDEFVFSSISTNEYILKSDDEIRFNNLCEELLKINNEMLKK